MKKHYVLLLIFTLLGHKKDLHAQKVDLDKFNFSFRHRSLPLNPLPSNIQTYSLRVRNNSGNGITESEIMERFALEGFRKSQNNRGDVVLELTLGNVFFEGSTVRSRKSEQKNKEGVVTTTYYYWVEAPYTYEANARVYDEKNGGATLITENYNRRDNYKSPESTNEKGVNEDFLRRRDEIRRGIVNDLTTQTINTFTQSVNRQMGYPIMTSRPNLWIMDTPRHPENQKHRQMTAQAARILERLRGDEPLPDNVVKDLEPAINYFKNLPLQYTSSDRNNRKFLYSAFYNLMWIYFCIDDLDNAIRYADELTANDFDAGDGRTIARNIDEVRNLFQRNKIQTRQFKRDEDMMRVFLR